MADESLLYSSMQREREEIVRIQSQLRQQQQQQQTQTTSMGERTVQAPPQLHQMPSKLNPGEQQQRLLQLQLQQQQLFHKEQQRIASGQNAAMMGRNGQQQRAMNKTDVAISTTSSAAQSSPSSSSSSSLVMASSPISSAIPSASFYCKNTLHPSLSAQSSSGSSMSSTSVPLSPSSAVPTSAAALSIGQHQQLAASFLLAQQQQRTTSHPHCPPANSPTAANKLLSPSSTSFAADAFPISLPAAPSPFASPFASRIHFNQQQQQLIAAAFPNLLMNTPSALLYPFANESVHNSNANEKFSESPCPTPAYHLSLAAPKPIIQGALNLSAAIAAATGQQQQAGILLGEFGMGMMGVDIRPADSATTPNGGNNIKATMEKGNNDCDYGMEAGAIEKSRRISSSSGYVEDNRTDEEIKQQQKQNQAEYLANKLPSWPSSFSSSADDDQPKSPNNTSRKAVPVFQITPQQLHMAMQQFFRSQQSKDSDSGDSTTSISSIASSTGTELSTRKRLKSNSSTSTSVKEEDADAVMVLEEEDAAEDSKVEEYVDVVGDGEARTNSFLKMQRKAHIEFYRRLKSFRNRGVQLDCQLCLSVVPNTDASIRSHVHNHCKTALFVCKLCQRGFQDQHLVFDHIGRDHPAHKGTQFIEDRRDMGVLMDLLSECFPRVLCRARDCLFEAIGRLTALSECQGQTQIQCRLCSVKVLAQKGALYGHLNQHPSYRCKKCKFSCPDERTQLEHQRREHPTLFDLGDRAYCVSLAFDILLDTLKNCFGGNGKITSKTMEKVGIESPTEFGKKAEEGKKPIEGKKEKAEIGKKKCGRKRKAPQTQQEQAAGRPTAQQNTGRKRRRQLTVSTTTTSGNEEEECSWTEDD